MNYVLKQWTKRQRNIKEIGVSIIYPKIIKDKIRYNQHLYFVTTFVTTVFVT